MELNGAAADIMDRKFSFLFFNNLNDKILRKTSLVNKNTVKINKI